jgi:hypothetical protein
MPIEEPINFHCRRSTCFLHAGSERKPKTESVLRWWVQEDGKTADISVNMNGNGMRNDPHDHHPEPKTRRIFATRLLQGIRKNK